MRTNWQKFIDRMTNETRARRMDPSKLEEVRILHRQMLEYLFNMFDEDDVRSIFPLRLLLLALEVAMLLLDKNPRKRINPDTAG